MKLITLVKLTDEGRKHLPDAKEVLRRVYELAESLDGKVEDIWARPDRALRLHRGRPNTRPRRRR